MAALEYFTVISDGLTSIEVDYVDLGTDPDEETIYAFVDFVPREKPGTTHWLSGLTPPRGIQLDPIRGRYSPEDGRLRTIIAHPTNEQQLVTVTGTPFTLSYMGQPTAPIAQGADPGVVEAALEALPNLDPVDIYVYRTARNEKQTISFSGNPSGGVFALAHPAHPTAFTTAIGRNSNSGYIQQALQNLSDIGPVGCSVVGPVGGPWVVEFTGPSAGVNVGMLLANSAGLTPSGTVVISETVAGSSTNPYRVNFVGGLQGTDVPQLTGTNCTIVTGTPGESAEGVKLVANTPVLELDTVGVSAVQLVVVNGNPSSGLWTLSLGGTPTIGLTGNESGANVAAALDGILGAGSVTVTKQGSEYTVTFGGQFADTPVDLMVADDSGLNRGSVVVSTIVEGVAQKLVELIYDVIFTVPDLDPLRVDRVVAPFGITAPRVGGVTVDLADAEYHLPPKPG